MKGQEVEVNKRLRLSGSRGHEVFFKPLVANERPRKVRAKRVHPYLENQELWTGGGKVPYAQSTGYRNLGPQPQATEKPFME